MVYENTLNTALGTCYLATYILHFANYACSGHLATEASCTFFSFVCARAGYLATCRKAYNTFFPT